MHGLPDDRGIGTFAWEPVQAGGPNALFERDGNRLRAGAEAFAAFDRIRGELGL